ncbi:amidohydrolase [Vibrio fluvialis]|uniref:amidohydrolase n=1 Tax=Vibrio sp. bablab_jr001 TaxID=2755067 RepID=UPI0018F122F6|nr:amidohydrolase [Vibrio sp. bablab_jr001]EKO3398416.1 amidohydrolase [Vibrio fluvialis]EKO3474173.1 amidohydrolase [Vibrio fluvialis]MBY8115233.1 amidohydrolase [Vibrio fluvialis]MBY8248325.1 amidohydrolase [Vibrio fluvialis]MBY8281995.1 amidohydrolase [Vibrio fluvialis]
MAEICWTQFRHTLHQYPELSNQEHQTAERILAQFGAFSPDEVVTGLGGRGVAFVFQGKEPGPTTLIRCELDALPIEETNQFAHRSVHQGVSHKCGHDGHMAIVTALGQQLSQQRPQKGRVVLAFQPAEETGEGAINMVNDAKFSAFMPDFAFALHNYPGLALGHVAVKAGPFNCASRGMIIRLKGKTSHAAHPENGVSPALAMCQIIEQLNALPASLTERCWVTVIHAKLGEIAFGTAPGEAVVMATLRSETNQAMETLVAAATQLAQQSAQASGLTWSLEWQDVFQASVNSSQGCDLVVQACQNTQTPCTLLEEPMRWSEDFGQFTAVAKEGAMFVLGSGRQSPQLHNPDYDFPDELTPIGQRIFSSLIEQINGFQS